MRVGRQNEDGIACATKARDPLPWHCLTYNCKFHLYIRKKPPVKRRLFDARSNALYLTGTKATGAYVNGSVATINYSLYPTDVGLPSSVGLTVRVRNVVTEGNALTADTTLSHFYTSKNPVIKTKILYKYFYLHKSAGLIITHNF